MLGLGVAKGALRALGSAFEAAPVATVGTGALLASQAAPSIGRALGDPLGDEMAQINRERSMAVMATARARRLRRLMAENTARLAAADPHTYYEVMAGRRLPTGAVVFGGRPRTDLMEQLTLDMSRGAYQPQAPEDELAALL